MYILRVVGGPREYFFGNFSFCVLRPQLCRWTQVHRQRVPLLQQLRWWLYTIRAFWNKMPQVKSPYERFSDFFDNFIKSYVTGLTLGDVATSDDSWFDKLTIMSNYFCKSGIVFHLLPIFFLPSAPASASLLQSSDCWTCQGWADFCWAVSIQIVSDLKAV